MAGPVSIHAAGVSTVETIAAGVQDLLNDIKNRAAKMSASSDPATTAQFQAYMLDMQTRLDMLKKLLDSVEQAVRSFHRP